MRPTLVLLIICIALSARAHITIDEARNYAEIFFSNKTAPSRANAATARDIREYELVRNCVLDEKGYYAFNVSSGGFVIVSSASNDNGQVLGYSTAGEFHYAELSDEEQASFDMYMTERSDNYTSQTSRNDQIVIEPLIKTKWGQDYPYNLLCPTIDGERCVTGCVATSMAQIMNYHKSQEIANVEHSYEWNGKILTVKLGDAPYRWDLLLNEYDENSPKECCDEVARLMRDCGYTINSSYTTYGTGGSEDNVYLALIKYFNYNPSIRFLSRYDCPNTEWDNILLSELKAGRPVMYSGGNSAAGHSFICDGYDGNGYFHFNFGWNGNDDGYFLSSIAGGFNDSQHIIYGIEKYSTGRHAWSGVINDDVKWLDNNNLSFPISFYAGYTSMPFYSGIALENISTKEITYLTKEKADWLNPSFRTLFSLDEPIADGNYIVYPVARLEDNDWEKFSSSDYFRSHVELTVSHGIKHFNNQEVNSPIDEGKIELNNVFYILDETNNTATVTFKNSRKDSYAGDIVIPEKISYQNKEYLVTSIGDNAFEKCLNLNSVTIPYCVKSIMGGAFSQSSISDIIIPENSEIEEMSGWAFNGCRNLSEFKVPSKVTILSKCLFQSAGFSRIIIPESVLSIVQWVFTDCSNLSEIEVSWMNPDNVNVHSDAFDNCGELSEKKLLVPEGTKSLYSNHPIWSQFNIIEKDKNSSISDIIESNDVVEICRYNTLGRVVDNNWKGIVIIKYSDGSSKKIIAK